jgi:CO/xanthine dehydrogenase FAD-binding subunit
VPVLVASALDHVLDALDHSPDATLLAGGTDLMVEVNEGHRRFPGGDDALVIALGGVPELTSYTIESDRIVLGSGIRWTELESEPLAALVPALAQAARTVGSPQIRKAGTIGGNLATCSPAGDGLPVLAALDASVRLCSSSGDRTLPVAEFMVGVKRTALGPGEIVRAVEIPRLDGWQGYSKVGVRNAMVIATASVCLAVHRPSHSIRIALGSVAPTVVRCPDAEAFAASEVDWDAGDVTPAVAAEVGRLARRSSRPIDDHRSTADYRRHAIGVMVTRAMHRAFPGRRG